MITRGIAAVIAMLMLLMTLGGCANVQSVVKKQEANLYVELANKGFPEAQVALGDMYSNGVGAQENVAQAIFWYERAARSGSVVGGKRLAKALSKGTGEHLAPHRAKNILLTLWETEGRQDVALELGRVIVEFPVTGTAKEATHWLTVALNRGDDVGHYYMGLMYKQGLLLEPDLMRAKKHFVKALDVVPVAAHELVDIYVKSDEASDVRTEVNKIISSKSFVGGKAAYHLANVFIKGKLFPVAPDMAESLYIKAVDGFPLAALRLAQLYAKYPEVDKGKQVFHWIERASAAGYEDEATLLHARILYEGRLIQGSPERAVHMYQSLSGDYVEANYHIGMIHKYGYLGESDYSAAYEYLLKAARMGMGKADYQLGELLTEGREITPKPEQAYAHYRLAADAGIAQAEQKMNGLIAEWPHTKIVRSSGMYAMEKSYRASN